MSIPLNRSRFSGRFIVSDFQNNKKYLADLLFSQSKGDPLTGWTLGGTTVPTIAADGQIDLFDNTGVGGSTQLYFDVPNTIGEFMGVLHFKCTRQNDDTNILYPFGAMLAPTATFITGMGYLHDGPNPYFRFVNSNYAGVNVIIASAINTINQEYSVDFILTPTNVIMLVDNVLVYSLVRSNTGLAPSSLTPNQQWRTANKKIGFFASHGAGQVAHRRVHDIKVGVFRGSSQ